MSNGDMCFRALLDALSDWMYLDQSYIDIKDLTVLTRVKRTVTPHGEMHLMADVSNSDTTSAQQAVTLLADRVS